MPGPVATRDIERWLLEQCGDTSVYVTKLRASCRRIGSPLSAPNLQLVVELTDTDRNYKCVHRIYCLLKLNFRLEG